MRDGDKNWRPHRPGLVYGSIVEGLNERVFSLYNQGRFRSALDEIFKVLDKDPHHPQALDLALIVVGGIRTTQLQAQEPLTTAYLLDRRLDPIVTVCSRCGKSWIGGDPLLQPGMQLFQNMIMINSGAPRPMQCGRCGYVLCSECITAMMADDPLDPGSLPTKCPVCGADELQRPAYPTGRPPQQMARHVEPVVEVLVFREGPVPPDEPYLREFMERFSPDAIEAHARLVGIPLFPWPMNVDGVVQERLAEKESRGEIPAGFLVEVAPARDDQGNRLYVAKIMQPASNPEPPTSAAKDRSVVSRWKESLSGWFSSRRPSELERTVEGLMRDHITRITDHQAFKSDARVLAFYRSLLDPAPLSFVKKTIAANLGAAQDADQECTGGQPVEGIFVLVSVVPQLVPDYAKSYFSGGYLRFLDTQLQQAGVRIDATSIAHWIYCTDGKNGAIHLTGLPRQGQRVVALEMLTAAERSRIGL